MVSEHEPGQWITERAIGIFGRCLMVTGAILIGIYVLARVHSVVMSRMALYQFSQAEQKMPAPTTVLSSPQGAKSSSNFCLWSMKRITAYEESFSKHFSPPQAVLEIPKIGLRVPVFDGTADLTLNRGVGRIIGTARLGQEGNVGIAGHRDGFFRGLKDVVVGDRIELETPEAREIYKVEQIQIVKPADVQVLENRSIPTLTLVTCYPFYFIGNAPLRYIVRASLSHESLKGKTNTRLNSTRSKIKNQEKTR